MTFSICVRERFADDDGAEQLRFGVAVTTRLPAVGTLCPWASEHGAIATQSLTNVELGRKGLTYLGAGLAIEDALEALLNADDGRANRQLHGVDAGGTFAFSGDECHGWYGHRTGENYTVAGNLLVGESVVEATAEAYEASAANAAAAPSDAADGGVAGADDGDGTAPLAERLIDALAAGQAEGGDRREDLRVQSAALLVRRTGDDPAYYEDLRVDASETPIADLRETYELAKAGHEDAIGRYGDDADED